MVCKNCGAEIASTSKFCSNCGSVVVTEQAVTESNKTITNATLLQSINAARNSSHLQNNSNVVANNNFVTNSSAVTNNQVTPAQSTTVATPAVGTSRVETANTVQTQTVATNANSVKNSEKPAKKPKAFGIISIIISSLMLIILTIGLLFVLLMRSVATPDAEGAISLVFFFTMFVTAFMPPVGLFLIDLPVLLSLIFSVVQLIKSRRKLSWVAFVMTIIVLILLVVVMVLGVGSVKLLQ